MRGRRGGGEGGREGVVRKGAGPNEADVSPWRAQCCPLLATAGSAVGRVQFSANRRTRWARPGAHRGGLQALPQMLGTTRIDPVRGGLPAITGDHAEHRSSEGTVPRGSPSRWAFSLISGSASVRAPPGSRENFAKVIHLCHSCLSSACCVPCAVLSTGHRHRSPATKLGNRLAIWFLRRADRLPAFSRRVFTATHLIRTRYSGTERLPHRRT